MALIKRFLGKLHDRRLPLVRHILRVCIRDMVFSRHDDVSLLSCFAHSPKTLAVVLPLGSTRQFVAKVGNLLLYNSVLSLRIQ
jgi:hypothetical protein